MSFRAYLAKRQATEFPASTFIADAQSDDALPDPASWQELKAHLRQRGACMEAQAAVHLVWNSHCEARELDDECDAQRA